MLPRITVRGPSYQLFMFIQSAKLHRHSTPHLRAAMAGFVKPGALQYKDLYRTSSHHARIESQCAAEWSWSKSNSLYAKWSEGQTTNFQDEMIWIDNLLDHLSSFPELFNTIIESSGLGPGPGNIQVLVFSEKGSHRSACSLHHEGLKKQQIHPELWSILSVSSCNKIGLQQSNHLAAQCN